MPQHNSMPQHNRLLPRIIGLTGNVGMGKTIVSNYLKATYQVPVLDADLYARAAVEPGSRGLQKIVERYGTEILLPTGALDRSHLGSIVFNNAAERQWLEQLIHPEVRRQMQSDLQQLAAQQQAVAVLVIPLLFEAEMTDLVTEIWVVQSPTAQQIERLQQRDPLSPEQIQARIASQMPIAEKIAQADVVLNNTSTPEHLFQQVDQAFAASRS